MINSTLVRLKKTIYWKRISKVKNMAWYSLLPDSMSTWETWIIRVFIFLGVLTIGPWAGLVIFDIVYYFARVIVYEFPFIGGRANGERKPRAPTLTERPSGRRRAFSLRGEEVAGKGSHSTTLEKELMMRRLVQTENEKT
ncbi:hypothetical protein TMatcc_004439 [Talaromyces marneffei ATCC 18224]|uniref:uncharacterized protein n=1 Tax=Talaromyces marneffei TaxID=37727 RepID=UPI0012A89CC9|nr:uncharacterized protein EYB26_000614 [Talaromyces marneffei]KAE8557014.1 hypothetical protein EYB25_001720 [Talaromyces marneffei]QGA12969.1 hypothetical protein EYB26_000614 [Talaromyces marneffei]